MKILSLNVRGLGSSNKRRWVKELISKEKVDFMAIQETKLISFNNSNIQALWGSMDVDFHFSPSNGASGGLVCMWNKSIFKKANILGGDGFIGVSGIWSGSDKDIMFINIYAPQSQNEKETPWNNIAAVINNWTGIICIMGDFNSVRYKQERKGSVFCQRDADLLLNFISNSGLVDLKLEGRKFTWVNKSGSKLSRIDRVLVSPSFLDAWPDSSLVALQRNLSDHCISKKLTKKGNRFGFVRFKLDQNAAKIEEGLNNVWFGSYKLRANKSKYSSMNSKKAPTTTRQVYKEKRAAGSNNNIIDGKLFSDVVANNKQESFVQKKISKKEQKTTTSESRKPVQEQPQILNLQSSEIGWHSNCLVGELKHNMSARSISMLMEKENFFIGAIRPIGGNKTLIDCLSSENRDQIFSKYEWWNVLFKWVVPWNKDFSTVGRVAKIRCYGVPLQTWCKDSFAEIASLCGEILEIDDATLYKSFLDYGMVTILTNFWDPIAKDINISVDNTIFSIKIVESPLDCDLKHERVHSDENSEEISSSDDYYSDSAAKDIMNDGESIFSGKNMEFSGNEVEETADSVHDSLIGKVVLAHNEDTSNKQTTADNFQDYGISPSNIKAVSNAEYPSTKSVKSSSEAHLLGTVPGKAQVGSSHLNKNSDVKA